MAGIRRFGQLSFFASIMAGVLTLSAECQEQKKYPVTLDGHTVIEIGYGYRALPPEQRSQLISEKLRKVADDPSVPASVRLEPADASITDLMAGENHLVSVLPGD